MKEIVDEMLIKDIIKKDLVVIIAKSKDCAVCKPISQRLEALMQDYPQIDLFEVYIDVVEKFRGEFLTFTVPTILIFSNGVEFLRESRFVDFDKIKRLLDLYVEN